MYVSEKRLTFCDSCGRSITTALGSSAQVPSSLKALGIFPRCYRRDVGEAHQGISVNEFLECVQMNEVETAADNVQGSLSKGPR